MSDSPPTTTHIQAKTVEIYFPAGVRGEELELRAAQLRRYAQSLESTVLEYRERPARAKTRPVFSEMMADAKRRKFGTLLVSSLDCFARSLPELLETLTSLKPFAIEFQSLDENIVIDQNIWDGHLLMFHLKVFVAAETHRNMRNVRAGVARAQQKGVHCGRPSRSFPRAEARKLRQQGLSIRAIAARIGVPASTVASALKADNRTETKPL